MSPQDRREGPPKQYFVPAPGAPSGPRQAPPRPQRAPRSEPSPARSRQPQTRPAPTPPAPPRPPTSPRRRRRFRPRWLLVIPALLLLAGIGMLWWAQDTYDSIERVDLSEVLDPVQGDATNYLLVGSDSRDEFDPEGDSGVTGRRSDTLILLRTTPEGSSMMSIPRDLWVELADTGEMGRVNGAYNRGPANLVLTVKQNLDIPINHYMEIGFGSFAGLVDAIGGITIDFPHPASDPASGLSVDQAGPVTLDGGQALAYARSRNYTEIIDGVPVTDATADLGRQERQQLFLRTALSEVGATRNPVTLVRVADAVSSELIVDSGLGFFEALSLVRTLGGSEPVSIVLPTEGARRGSASVLVLVEPDAQAVLDGFR